MADQLSRPYDDTYEYDDEDSDNSELKLTRTKARPSLRVDTSPVTPSEDDSDHDTTPTQASVSEGIPAVTVPSNTPSNPLNCQLRNIPLFGGPARFEFDPPTEPTSPESTQGRYYFEFDLPSEPAPPESLQGVLYNQHFAGDMTATSPARGGVSPSSSPRLPSPPPFTEVQIGPKSPSVGDADRENQLGDAARLQEGATRRIRPGTKAADMATGPPLVPLNQIDSPFQLQEHLKALHYTYTHDSTTHRQIPITKETALQLAHPAEIGNSDPSNTIDRNLWLYELCRMLVSQANALIVAFFGDNPPCSAATCPEMRASEWQYLCAVHDPPKSCCAIDYCDHTLDWAMNILTSPKYFPSRLSLGGESGNIGPSMRHLTNIFRRVYRIFAHAWFQHRAVFWEVEGRHGLYIFFKTVCDVYQLIPEDNYTIPPEAEGGADEDHLETPVSTASPGLGSQPMQILVKNGAEEEGQGQGQVQDQEGETTTTVSVGATTRRHKHTPSTGIHVATISEGMEEEESGQGGELRSVEDPTPVAEVEDPMANLKISDDGPGEAIETEEAGGTVKEDVAGKDEELEKLSESVVGESSDEVNEGEAEREKTVQA